MIGADRMLHAAQVRDAERRAAAAPRHRVVDGAGSVRVRELIDRERTAVDGAARQGADR